MNEAYSRIQNIDTMISQSFAFANGGRGRGRCCGSGGGCSSEGGRDRDRDYHYCQKTNHTSKKCWVKFGKQD